MPQYYAQLWADNGSGGYDRVTVPIGGALDSLGLPTKDGGPAWTSILGVVASSNPQRVTSADASGADLAVTAAPTTGEFICPTDVLISVDTAMRVDLKCETSGAVLASIYLPANGTFQWTPRSKVKLNTVNKKLMVRTSAAGNISVTAQYYSEA